MHSRFFELYDSECRRLGREPGRKYGPSALGNIHLARDPEKVWARVMPHLKHVVAEYGKWADAEPNSNSPFKGLLQDEQALRRCGIFTVLTPGELLEKAPPLVGDHGSLSFMPLLRGLAPELGWESLELLKSVMPSLQNVKGAVR